MRARADRHSLLSVNQSLSSESLRRRRRKKNLKMHNEFFAFRAPLASPQFQTRIDGDLESDI